MNQNTTVRNRDYKLITTFGYDDRGFRLNKITYDENGDAKLATWYVRDAIGVPISTYEDDLSDAEPPEQTEIPVYASGRIGLLKPQYNLTFYELTDHLGNVRAVIGDTVSTEYLATMEAERSAAEECEGCPFINLKTDEGPTYVNHTPGEVTVDGEKYTIENPDQVIRLNNAIGTEKSPIGGGIILPVYPGDTISAEVYAKYQNFDDGNKTSVTGIAAYLATTFGPARSIIDGVNIFNGLDQTPAGVFKTLEDVDETLPKAFLTYIVYDRNYVPVKFNYDQISTDAKIPDATKGEGDPFTHEHERLALEDIEIEKEGFIYIYVSNESDQNMEVFFDDLRVKHLYSNIVAGNDYYPFGLEIEDRRITREDYRFGYQGQFAEKDEETGWNHFELREYDPIIGRWTSTDPYGQHYSPYMGMGNNPVGGVDPDGGFDWVQNASGEIYWDPNATSQATTKSGETYLGRNLTFTFNSFIDEGLWDGPLGSFPAGDKIVSTVELISHTDNQNNLISVDIISSNVINATGGIFTTWDYFPGQTNTAVNVLGMKGGTVTYEQHGRVNGFEAAGLDIMGYDVVNVAQKLTLGLHGNRLSVSAATDIFPSAISVNNAQLFRYAQPSFKATHGRDIIFGDNGMGGSTLGGTPRRPAPSFYQRYNK